MSMTTAQILQLPPRVPDGKLDWGVMRLKYELLGEPVGTLAREALLTEEWLQTEISVRGWQTQELPSLPALNTRDLDTLALKNYVEKLQTVAKVRTKILAIYCELYLHPKYIEIESVLLAKLRDTIDTAKSLKDITRATGAFTQLIERRTLSPGTPEDGVTINLFPGLDDE